MSQQPPNKNGPGFSRRRFLQGSGATAAATAFATSPVGALADVAHATGTRAPTGFGPGAVPCELRVNDAKITVNIEPRVTLLDALRHYVDITGPKRVCDRGTCGACTCIVDGKPVYSCTMLALEAQGRKIETAEAMATETALHPVAAAFVKHDAQQCGFCTPGFTTAMKAAFDKNPKATPAEIEAALSGNICRCGTYQQMRDAIRDLCKAGGGERKGG